MSYDWTRFSITFFYYAPLARVFRAWATPGGLESFFVAECRTACGKDEFVRADEECVFRYVHGYEHGGRFLELRENELVSFTFGAMEVAVTFGEVEGGAEVVLRQSGIEERVMSHMNCRSCWLYFMTNLKSVLEHGIDLRDTEHPDRASSMEVGYAESRPPA